MFGNVIRRNNDDFVVMCDIAVKGSGYNVVPRSVDAYNLYDIEEVRRYCLDNPDKVFTDYAIPERDLLIAEREAKKAWLDDNDWEATKCVEQLAELALKHGISTEGKTADVLIGEVIDAEYPSLRLQKQNYRDRIEEIDELLKRFN